MRLISLVIQGEIPSKKNAWRRGERSIYIEKDMARQLGLLVMQVRVSPQRPPEPVKEFVRVELRFYGKYKTDLDNRVTTVLDLLQKGGIISNDRNVRFIEAGDISLSVSRDYYTEIFVDKSTGIP